MYKASALNTKFTTNIHNTKIAPNYTGKPNGTRLLTLDCDQPGLGSEGMRSRLDAAAKACGGVRIYLK